jgi:hypothetical protein
MTTLATILVSSGPLPRHSDKYAFEVKWTASARGRGPQLGDDHQPQRQRDDVWLPELRRPTS